MYILYIYKEYLKLFRIDGVNLNIEGLATSKPRNNGITGGGINSVWDAKPQAAGKANESEQINPQTAQKEEKLDKAIAAYNEISASKSFFQKCKELKDSDLPVMSTLGFLFENTQKTLSEKASAILSEMSLARANLEASNVESLINQLNQISAKIKNLNSKTSKTVEINKNLNDFVSRGGDINLIDMDKLSTDIMKSLENGDESSLGQNLENVGNIKDKDGDDIDKKLDEFIKLLQRGDTEELKKSKLDYVKKDNQTINSDNTESENSANPFVQKKNKNPFEF